MLMVEFKTFGCPGARFGLIRFRRLMFIGHNITSDIKTVKLSFIFIVTRFFAMVKLKYLYNLNCQIVKILNKSLNTG